ncbi:hypothetical protein V8F20_011021, partial [Naviculisporaceae sp. PSN 640]
MSEAQQENGDSLLAQSDEAFEVFHIAGDFTKLQEAIKLLIDYNEKYPPTEDDSIGILAFKLARCGQALYERSGAILDIERAVSNAEAAVARVPSTLSDVDRGSLLGERCCILSKCLVSQGLSRDCKKPESLEKSLEPLDKALKELEMLGQTDTDGYFRLLWQKASCKQRLWDRTTRDVKDLESCLTLSFKVLDLSRKYADNNERAQIFGELAARLLRAYTYERGTDQRLAEGTIPNKIYANGLCEQAITYLSVAEGLPVERELTKLDNIISVTDDLHKIPEADQRPLLGKLRGILQSNVKRLQDVMQTALKGDVRAHAEKYFGLPRDAAAAATEVGEDAFTALKILDDGRHITSTTGLGSQIRALGKEEGGKLEELTLKLDRLIEEEAPYEERQKAVKSLASEGPVVAINVGNVRSDAYIVTTSGIHSVWLPKLKNLGLFSLSWKVQWRLAQDTFDDWDYLQKKLNVKIKDLYLYVWRNVTKPILDNLGFQLREDNITNWPRICWISRGTLSLYPIGLSGFGFGQRGNAFNRVISTYAP